MADTSDKVRNGAQSIHRAMTLLKAVGNNNAQGATLKRLAEQTGLHPATAHRLLQALCGEGMTTLDSYSKRYFLGLAMHEMTDALSFGTIRARLRPALVEIAAKTGDVAYLYLPIGTDAICAERVEGTHPLQALIRTVGARLPLGIGAAGIAMLATMPEATAQEIVTANAGRYPEYNGLAAGVVWDMVRRARKLGYGLNDERVLPGVTGVGIAVMGADARAVAGITVVSSAARLSGRRRAEVVAAMRAALAAVTETSGTVH